MNKTKITTKQITAVAVLMAMEIILTRVLSVTTPEVRYSIGFLPIAMIGVLFGPVYAGVSAAMSDFIGAMLLPRGAFFPGFTFSAALIGITYGLLLHKKQDLLRIAIAAFVVTVVWQLGLETLWVAIITGDGDTLLPIYIARLPMRTVRTAIMLPVQVILIRLASDRRVIGVLQNQA